MARWPELERPRYALYRRTEPGSAPGTLIADPAAPRPRLRLIEYGPAGIDDAGDVDVERIEADRKSVV